VRSISLDRLQASLVPRTVSKPSGAVEVANSPPRVIVSNVPAILVPIDGAPVMKPVPNHSRVQRVINTRALILRGGFGDNYYLHVYDGWLSSASLDGPWTQASPGPLIANELKAIAAELSKNNAVDLLSGGPNANPKPSLADGVPVIYTSQAPAELIVFKGQPDFVPIVGTQLLWASNTTSDVLIDITSNTYYVLLAGRWFRGPAMTGPLDVRAEQCAAGGLCQDPGGVARRCRVAYGRRHAAGTGRGDRKFDTADRHGSVEGRPHVHAELRRRARSSCRWRARRSLMPPIRPSRSFRSRPTPTTR
jgi:hypothetical protein